MGCDIHLHTEVKIYDEWHHYSACNVERNYRLFSLLADVRNDEIGDKWHIEPISKPRGLPQDVALLTRFAADLEGDDGHSHSWIGAEEIVRVVEYARANKWKNDFGYGFWESDNFGYLFGNSWSGWLNYKDDPHGGYPEQITDIRFVFWFDN